MVIDRLDKVVLVVGTCEGWAPSNAGHRARPDWIVATGLLEEGAELREAGLVKVRAPSARLAAFGKEDDIERFERWHARGASVYLALPLDWSRLVDAISFADRFGAVVIDRCFPGEQRRRRQELSLLSADSPLTRRETETLGLLRSGHTNAEIARDLSISEHTVEFHVGNILSKLRAANRVQAAEHARLLGI